MEPCVKQADIAALQSDVKALFKRIDEQMTLSRAIYDLVAEVRVMNERLVNLSASHDQLKRDVEALKANPGKRWEKIAATALTAVTGGLVAYIMLRLGLS